MPAFLFLVIGAVVIGFIVYRQAELFMVSVRDGRVLVVRGRVPGGFVSDLRTVVSSPRVKRATITARRQASGARLSVSGDIDEGRTQRLRNIFALYPASKLRTAPSIAKPTLGQLLGIAWLAWLFERSRT